MLSSIRKKLVIVGDGGSGKTCLLVACAEKYFLESYVATIFQNYEVKIAVDGKLVDLALWDTAGQEEYDSLRPHTYPGANIALVCFNVDSMISYENVSRKWIPEIKKHCEGVPIILVGTKIDLRKGEQNICITTEEGEALATEVGAYIYIETSSKTMEGLQQLFDTAATVSLIPKLKSKKKKKKGLNFCKTQ